MTAFLKEVRSGMAPLPTPISEYVTAVVKAEGLVELEGYYATDGPGSNYLHDLLVMRRIAQDEAKGEGLARFLSRLPNGDAILQRGGQRFFAKYIFAGIQGHDRLAGMVAIP